MIKDETKTIGERGYSYTVQQFGAREGGRMLVRLGKLLGKPVGDAVSAGESLQLETVGRVISGLADSITEQDFDQLVDAFSKRTKVTGGEYGSKTIPLSTEGVLDLHFAGAYGELVSWLMFAIEVNYADFLSGLGGAKLSDLARELRASPAAEAGEASP